MTRVLSVIVAVLLMAAPAAAQRLTDTVIPEHYTLWFAPDLDKETFRGRSTIQAVVTEPTSSVTGVGNAPSLSTRHTSTRRRAARSW